MRLLGDNGAGYELAQRLEENSVWRAWLGEREYVLLQPYLATPGTWSAFMQTENPSVIALQLRVRALLFDKALVSLHVESAKTSPPSALDNSFLQLHPDNVYFTLEHDVEDWARLQAGESPTLAALQLKHGLDSSVSITRSSKLKDAESGHGGISSRPIKASQSGQSASSALISPRQLANRTHAKTGSSISGNALDHRTLGELWYTQYLQRDLMNRMNRLARRTAQRGLPFGDQEACLRTPMEMADYVSNQANHRKRRPVFRIDGESKQILSGHERSIHGGDDGALFTPEYQYLANCVPENAVPAGPDPSINGLSAQGAFLDKLDHLRDLSSDPFIKGKDRLGPSTEDGNHRFKKDAFGRGNSKEIGHKSGCSDEVAQQLAEQAVVRLVAAAGFEGLKQAPLRILAELLMRHVQKLGSLLRRIVDTYKTECSQAELLKMCMHGASGSKLEELMEYYTKFMQQSQKRRPAPVQMPQQTIQQIERLIARTGASSLLCMHHQVSGPGQGSSSRDVDTVGVQALARQQISPHPVSMPLMMPYQHIQAQQLQPGYERLTNRRQSSSPGVSNRGDRFELVAGDTKPGGEIALESSTSTTGLSQILSQPLSQGHISWSSQAPNMAGLAQIHQPPMLQHFKQQLASLQIPSVQQNSLYAKDSGALKLPSPRIQGLPDISVSDSIKHEFDDQGQGSQFSPSIPIRKQNQRSWGYGD